MAAQSTLRRRSRALVRGAAALALGAALQGCLIYEAAREPNRVATESLPTAGPSPRLDVIFRHRHRVDGAESLGTGVELTTALLLASFERVRTETPLLAAVEYGGADPELVLEVDTEVDERGSAGVFLAGLSLGLLPAVTTQDLTLRAVLRDRAGAELGSYRASSRSRAIGHLLLFPALPLLIARQPSQRIADDTFRDLLLQLAPALERRPVAG